jgi:hypothetical protein
MAWNLTRFIAISPGGDSPRNISSILSGEGFDEMERGESPFEQFHLYRPTNDNLVTQA